MDENEKNSNGFKYGESDGSVTEPITTVSQEKSAERQDNSVNQDSVRESSSYLPSYSGENNSHTDSGFRQHGSSAAGSSAASSSSSGNYSHPAYTGYPGTMNTGQYENRMSNDGGNSGAGVVSSSENPQRGWLYSAAGFVASLVFFPLGIILSIMGLKESKAVGHRQGEVLAKIGLWWSIIQGLLVIAWLAFIATFGMIAMSQGYDRYDNLPAQVEPYHNNSSLHIQPDTSSMV